MRFILLFTLCATLLTGCFGRNSAETEVQRIMTDEGLLLAVAEGCTGGRIAARLIKHPGASAYFECGVVAYSNETINQLFHVDMDTILLYGAVSEKVTGMMAESLLRLTHADYAIATTGIAGPTGGTVDMPVGTVWIAIASPSKVEVVKYHAGSTRREVMDRASTHALKLLLRELKPQD